MSTPPLAQAVGYLRKLAHAGEDADSDAALLTRFLQRRDDGAFAALVERHGAMVLGVCRRALGQAQDAEDAFQATFLVLARRARGVRCRASLGSWLHGVAWRVAGKLRARRTRQGDVEAAAPRRDSPSALDDITWREAQAVLDHELERLPGHWRAPLVLCYLEGKTRDEAARELGWPLATLRGRLERGREQLRRRLIRRGLAPSASLLAVAVAQPTLAATPSPSLSAQVVEYALHLARGEGARLVPAHVARLAQEVIAVQALRNLKIVGAGLAMLLVVGLLAVALGLPGGEAPRLFATLEEHREAEATPPEPDAGVELPKQPQAGAIGDERPPAPKPGNPEPPPAVKDPPAPAPADTPPKANIPRTLPGEKLDGPVSRVAFSTDGKRLLVAQQRKFTLWDVPEQKPIAYLDKVNEISWSAVAGITTDGKAWLVREHARDTRGITAIALVDLETGQKRTIIKMAPGLYQYALSPDGKYLAQRSLEEPHYNRIILWDAVTGRQVTVLPGKQTGMIATMAFTPDSKILVAGGVASYRYNDSFLKAWDIGSRKELFTATKPYDASPHFSIAANSRFVAAGQQKHSVRVTELATGEQVGLIPLPKDKDRPSGVELRPALSPDGSRIAIARLVDAGKMRSEIVLFDVARGKPIATLAEHVPQVTALTYSPDGAWIATGDDQGNVTIRNAEGNRSTQP